MPVSPIQTYLEQLHARHAKETAGRVADYIPELQLADPNWFGICIATHDGHVYEVGDSAFPFTIQSVSKAFVFGLALDLLGTQHVESFVGVEPSGEAFNSIRLNEPLSKRRFGNIVRFEIGNCTPAIVDPTTFTSSLPHNITQKSLWNN